jgi:glycerol-3-phosphate O-acyltransferase/dihydroxyacetone phosphate acyltransferase
MLYSFLRSFCRVALAIFYREVQVIGTVDHGGPMILVANHPSTLNDALLVACQLDRPVSIIAKGSLFANPLSATFLRSCGVLPVMRRDFERAGQSDAQNTDQSAAPNTAPNDDTFEAIYECLRDGGVVLIFGEGTSHLEKRLMPLKTGAARMAIGAEERFGPLGVRLVPVGLNYEDPQAFGVSVQLRFGEPLPALPFLDRAGDNREAARELTNQVEAALAQEVVHLEAPDVADVLVAIDRWIRRDYLGTGMNRLDVTRAIAQMLNRATHEQAERLASFKTRLREYHAFLKVAGLSDDALLDRRPLQLQEIALVGLIFPLWLYGAVNHYIPYKFPKLAITVLRIDPVYDSTVRLMTGIVAFFTSYVAQTLLVAWAFGGMLAVIYLVTLPGPSGSSPSRLSTLTTP